LKVSPTIHAIQCDVAIDLEIDGSAGALAKAARGFEGDEISRCPRITQSPSCLFASLDGSVDDFMG